LIGCHVFTAIADFEQRWRQSKNCKLKLQAYFSLYICDYVAHISAIGKHSIGIDKMFFATTKSGYSS